LRKNKTWQSLFYSAHTGFDDFSNLLWPERWSEAQLRQRRQEFIEDGDAAGYSQEFLNNPLDHSDAFLKVADFLPMREDDFETDKIVCAAADFAVSRADKANRTAFVVGGKDVNNTLHHLDVRKGRWDTVEWIDEMFAIQLRWNPDVFWVEDGVIWKSVRPMVMREMQVRDIRINFEAILPIKDKGTRGRSYQRRMRSGQCRFDKKAEWYADFEQENLRFTGTAQATLDDQFDAAALLSRGFDDLAQVEPEDFFDDEDWALDVGFHNRPKQAADGRSRVTGY
jgi:predicted phage terminase large subunit-like protein